jgi:hypothetical protein
MSGMTDLYAGVEMGIKRRQMMQELEAETRRMKEADRALVEDTNRARMEAQLLGLPKPQAQAMGVGELKGFIDATKTKEKEKLQQESAQRVMRDVRATAATAKPASGLSAAELNFFMKQAGVGNAGSAMALWDEMPRMDRARLMGVSDKAVIDDLMNQVKEENVRSGNTVADKRLTFDQQKEAEDRRRYADAAAQRTATLDQTQANTTAARVNTKATEETQMRKGNRDAAVKKDVGMYPDGQPVTRLDRKTGIVQIHVPGDVDENGIAVWKVAPSVDPLRAKMIDAMARGDTGKTGETGNGEAPEGKVDEVRRTTKDGRIAVFDEKTKKFLRFED